MLPRIYGHRGVVEYAPENSISGAYIAKVLKVGAIEIDAQLSADNYPIVFHDTTLDRCTGEPGIVCQKKYRDLYKYDISSYMNQKVSIYKNERIPLLKTMLKVCHTMNIFVNTEIKADSDDDLATPLLVCECIKKYSSSNNTVVSSYSIKALEIAKYIIPDFKRMYIVDEIPNNWIEILEKYECYGMVISKDHNSIDDIIAISNRGFDIYVFTVNDKDTFDILSKYGIGIITDYPCTLSNSNDALET